MGYLSKRITITSSGWTPILSIRSQSSLAFYNLEGQDMLLRSDQTNAETEWPLSGNTQEIIYGARDAFNEGQPIFYAKQVVPGSSVALLKMP